MRFIGTKAHGYIDYIMGLLLIASPWVFNFNRDGAETWVPVILGVGMILYSLFTNYELGASPRISMKTHLTLDVIAGLLLAVSPWLFQFADYVWEPHVIFGILEMGTAMMTKTTRGAETGRSSHTRHTTAMR